MINQINWIEIIGYTASVFVAISLTMKSITKLRALNFIGAMLFGTYGLLIESIPVMLLNYFIAITNIYYLWKIFKTNGNKQLKIKL